MNKFPIFSLIFFLSWSIFSQKTYNLPEGFKIYKTHNEEEVRCDNDFDNDGINDVAIFCINDEETEGRICIYLSTRYLNDNDYFWFSWPTDMYYDLKYENGVLSLSNFIGFGSNATTTLFLKYFKDLQNMRLINYETQYTSSMKLHFQKINLISGEFQVDNKKGKKNFDVITLTNIENYLDMLSSVGY